MSHNLEEDDMRRFDTIDPSLVTGGPGQGQCHVPRCTLVVGHDCEHAEASYSGLVFEVLGDAYEDDDDGELYVTADEREALEKIYSLCDQIEDLTEELDWYLRSLQDRPEVKRVYSYVQSGPTFSFEWPISAEPEFWAEELADWASA